MNAEAFDSGVVGTGIVLTLWEKLLSRMAHALVRCGKVIMAAEPMLVAWQNECSIRKGKGKL